jgi:hypothetical protein
VGGHLETVLAHVALEDLVGIDTQIPEGVDGDQHMANIGINLGAFESLLQVLIDGLVGDLTQQSQIGDTNLLLLSCLKGGLLGLRDSVCAVRGWAGALVLGASRYSLRREENMSAK